MDHRHAKQRRAAQLAGLAGVSSQTLSKILQELHDDPAEPVSGWSLNKFLHEEFAPLKLDINLRLGADKDFTWTVCSVPKFVEDLQPRHLAFVQ